MTQHVIGVGCDYVCNILGCYFLQGFVKTSTKTGSAVLSDIPGTDSNRAVGTEGCNCNAGIHAIRVKLTGQNCQRRRNKQILEF